MSQSRETEGSGEATKLRVLVVDDEPTLRLGFAYALSSKTTTVETAATGRHALERIAATKFDVMILDLRMPELDGLGVIDALRGQGNNLPTVLCSAALSPNAALRAIRLGVVDFLLKPVRPVDLRQVIEFVLRPGKQSFPLAMHAARNGRLQEAIRLLSGESAPSRQMSSWLNVLKSIHADANHGFSDHLRQDHVLEERVRESLTMLAFNASPAP